MKMEVKETPIQGVLLIKPKVFRDERGYFLETWQKERYEDLGISHPFVQDNYSKSTKGILRGLHYQKKHPQGKLIRVPVGEIFDVVVDIRKDSLTFGKWYGTLLSEDNQCQLWIPPGLAHGFVVLSEIAHCHYKCTDYYHPEDEGIIRWDDPILNIQWPVSGPQLSEKDSRAPLLSQVIGGL